jgi:hypothetical protein
MSRTKTEALSREQLAAKLQERETQLAQLREHMDRADAEELTLTYVNQAQLAEILGVHYKSLWRWRERGDGPPWFKLPGEVCYPVDQLLEWFEENSHDGGGLPPKLRELTQQEAA